MLRHMIWLSASGLADACRDIKHLYHYYLHGSSGRRGGQERLAALKDGLAPEIIIQCIKNNRLDWRKSLVDVCDDMESKYLEVNYTTLVMPVSATAAHPHCLCAAQVSCHVHQCMDVQYHKHGHAS